MPIREDRDSQIRTAEATACPNPVPPEPSQRPETENISGNPHEEACEQLQTLREVMRTAVNQLTNLNSKLKQWRSQQRSTQRELDTLRQHLRHLRKVPID